MTWIVWPWHRPDPVIDDLIHTPKQTHEKATPTDYETILAAADRRRDAADDKRREAARIQSGQPVAERLRLVGRGGKP
jgi:hypothetical protein